MSFFSGLDKRQTISWAFYDFANSAYTLIVASFVFPIYFKEVVAGGGALGDLLWGIVVSTSILLGALAAPVIGAMAEVHHGTTMTAIDPIDVIKKALRRRPSLVRLARHVVW